MISKIKLKPGVVEIHTEQMIKDNEKTTIHKSFEEPHPAFVNAMADAVKTVYKLLQWDGSYRTGAVRVTGLSISESESGIRGYVITGMVGLDTTDSPFNFNTPHIPSAPYGEGAGGKVMEQIDVDRMNLIIDEAQAFLDGKRAQGELPGVSDSNDGKLPAAGLETGGTEVFAPEMYPK